MAYKREKIDYEKIERMASEGLSDAAISRNLGKSNGYAAMMKAKNEEFRAALLRGREGGSGQTLKSAGAVSDDEPETVERELSAEEFYRYGREKLSHAEIAAAAGFPNHIGVSQLFHKFPELRMAYERGKNGLPLEDEPEQDVFDENFLDEIEKCVCEKKLFFVRDIADHLGQQSVGIYRALGELVARGRLCRDEKGSDGVSYREPRVGEESAPETPAGEKPFGKLAQEEIEEKIFAAVDARYATVNQIKRFNGWALSVDLSAHLEKLCWDDKLTRVENEAETITAFFRPSKMPKTNSFGKGRFYTNGAYLEVEYADEAKASTLAPTNASVAPVGAKPPVAQSSEGQGIEPFVAAEALVGNEIFDALPVKTEKPKANGFRERPSGKLSVKPRRERLIVTEDDIVEMERFGELHKNQEKTADALKISVSGLHQRLKKHPELKEAYRRGIDARKSGKPEREKAASNEAFARRLEDFAFEGLTLKESAERLGITYEELKSRLKTVPGAKAAYIHGAERRFEKFGFDSSLEAIAEAFEELSDLQRQAKEPVVGVDMGRGDRTLVVKICPQCEKPFTGTPVITMEGDFCGMQCWGEYKESKTAKQTVDVTVGDEKTAENTEAVAVEPRFEHLRQELVKPGSREGILEVENSLAIKETPRNLPEMILMPPGMPTEPELEALPEPNLKTLDLGAAGSVDIALQVDLFETDDADFQFLYQLTRLVRAHKARKGGGAQ